MARIWRRSRPANTAAPLFVYTFLLLFGFVSAANISGPVQSSSGVPKVRTTSPGAGLALPLAESRNIASTLLHERQPWLLCVFAFVRGIPDKEPSSLESSRRSLREVMPSGIDYDEIVFHEGNVASEAHLMLSFIS